MPKSKSPNIHHIKLNMMNNTNKIYNEENDFSSFGINGIKID